MELVPLEQRYEGSKQALGSSLIEKIRTTKVLVVGAGGIGCELLKNLVLSGFEDIEVIDLDTIDYSNLNRQFLFSKQHVGMSKSRVAKESVLKYNPNAKIKSHHGNIKDPDYGTSYIESFSLVMNALDNLSARRHVNRVCLAANVPLLESGTAGYLGQVQVIRKGSTECFECEPKPSPTTYPVCTIRSNPTKPIHCIIWAKMLFLRLFGKTDDSNAVTDLEEVEKNDEEENIEDLDQEEKLSIGRVKQLMEKDKIRLAEEKQNSFERWMFHKVFHTDVLYLCTLKTLWRGKQDPKPLVLDEILSSTETEKEETTQHGILPDQFVWSLRKNAEVFLNSTRLLKEMTEDNKPLEWEKDDDLHLDFVTSATNLRCIIFNLSTSSRFDVKSEAGNVIPAIATTNAIIAGLMVMEAFKLLSNQENRCRYTYLYKQPSRGRVLMPAKLSPPNPKCYVCGSKFARIQVNTLTMMFEHFLNQIVKKEFNIHSPCVYLGESCIYEADHDGDDDDMGMDYQLAKTLHQLNIIDNSILKLEDYVTDYELHVTIQHQTTFTDLEKPYEISGDLPSTQPKTLTTTTTTTTPTTQTTTTTTTTPTQSNDHDDVIIVNNFSKTINIKRKREEVEEEKGEEKQKDQKRLKSQSLDVIDLDD